MGSKFFGYRKMHLRELQLLQLETMKLIHEVCGKHKIKYYMIGGTLLGAIRHKGFIPWDDDIDIAMMRSDYDKFLKVFDDEFNTSRYFLQHYDSDNDFQPALMRFCVKGTILDIPSQYHLRNCKNIYIDIFPLDNVPDADKERIAHIKSLNRIDNLIRHKLYHIFPSNSSMQILLKKIIAFALKPISLSMLQKKRLEIMSKYSCVETMCVASTCSQYGYRKQIMDRRIYGKPTLYGFEDAFFYGPELFDVYLKRLYGENYMQIPPEKKRVLPHDTYIMEDLNV